MKKEKPTCFDCKEAEIWPGSMATREYPEDKPQAECTLMLWETLQDEDMSYGYKSCEGCPFFRNRRLNWRK